MRASGALTLKSVKPGSAGAIARFAEIADRGAAEALRGTLADRPALGAAAARARANIIMPT